MHDKLLTLVKKTETEVVWPHLKVWFSKDNSTGHSERKKKGKQKKRLEDNIKKWTEMDYSNSPRTIDIRTRWKGTVAKPYVVPQGLRKVMG